MKRRLISRIAMCLSFALIMVCALFTKTEAASKWKYINPYQKTVFDVEYVGSSVFFNTNKNYASNNRGKKLSTWFKDVGITKYEQIDHMKVTCTTLKKTIATYNKATILRGKDSADEVTLAQSFETSGDVKLKLKTGKTYNFRFEFFDKNNKSLWHENVKFLQPKKPTVKVKNYTKSGKTYRKFTVTSAPNAAYINFECDRHENDGDAVILNKTLKYKKKLSYTKPPYTKKGDYVMLVYSISKYGNYCSYAYSYDFKVKDKK